MPRSTKTKGFVVAAASSGIGKTTVCSAICSALASAGHVVQPFKTGPDYVDPTFLSLGAGRSCRNLDGFPNPYKMPFFYAEGCRARDGAPAADIAVIEGVMGMYDGLGVEGLYSTAWLARTLDLPVVLLADAKAAATSVAATAHGFASLEGLAPRVVGVIANRVSGEAHAELIREALERYAGLPLLGWLPHIPDVEFPSRHLGLIPATERRGTEEKLARVAAAVREHFDLARLAAVAKAPRARVQIPKLPNAVRKRGWSPVRVAVARDRAFCFHYPENWELLERLGAEVVFTSPLHDASVPQGADVLILPGGYPEEFAGELSGNDSYLRSLRAFALSGKIYAECGGMMYLSGAIRLGEERFPMAGLIRAVAVQTDRLQRFGYVRARSLGDNLLCKRDEELRAHEFHYSKMVAPESAGKENAFDVRRASGRGAGWTDGFASNGEQEKPRILATYLHLNFYSCPGAAARLLGG